MLQRSRLSGGAACAGEVGIGATIVQIPGLTRDDIRIAGTLVFLNGILYFTLAQLLAPLAGEFLRIDGVTVGGTA